MAGRAAAPVDAPPGTTGWLRWPVGAGIGVLVAWLVSAATFGILTFGGLFLGAFLAGRVGGARSIVEWAAASLLTVTGFVILYVQAAAVAI